MKAAVCAVLLLLTLCQAEALKCNKCWSLGSNLCTTTSIMTCKRITDKCISVTNPFLDNSFRSCVTPKMCERCMAAAHAEVTCCTGDLCN